MIDINKEIKSAMIAKDKMRLASLRAVKSAFILANTEKGAEELNLEGQIKIIQKQATKRSCSHLTASSIRFGARRIGASSDPRKLFTRSNVRNRSYRSSEGNYC